MLQRDRRLERQGHILSSADGCATIEVDVPCASCAAPCGTPQRPRQLALTALSTATGDDEVQLSVSARALNTAVFGAFGPALVLFGALALLAPRSPAAAVILGLLGLPLALVLGGHLAARGAALLDLRVRSEIGKTDKSAGLSGEISTGDRPIRNQEVR